MSGNDINEHGQFEWKTNSLPFGYSNWGQGEPHLKNGSCVAVDPEFKWGDFDCNAMHHFVCEYKKPIN